MLGRHGLWASVPEAVRTHLADAARAESPELDGSGIDTLMLVSGELACAAMAERATQRGFSPVVLSTSIEGESREVGATLVSLARESHTRGRPFPPPCMLVGCGGETTVTVTNGAEFGTGGPNQVGAAGAELGAVGDRDRGLAAAADQHAGRWEGPAAGVRLTGQRHQRGADLAALALDAGGQDDRAVAALRRALGHRRQASSPLTSISVSMPEASSAGDSAQAASARWARTGPGHRRP